MNAGELRGIRLLIAVTEDILAEHRKVSPA